MQGPAMSPGGGLSAEGYHHDCKLGGYHCHHAPKQANAPAKSMAIPQPSPSAPPNCCVCAKLAIYALTPRGRKKYKGCWGSPQEFTW